MGHLFASAFLVVWVVGCGDDSRPGGRDVGPGGSDAGDVDAGERMDAAAEVCSGDPACDDGVFCNGLERCLPDDPSADADGCVADPAFTCDDGVVCTTDTCAEGDRRCLHLPPDGDGDGHGDVACIDTGGMPIGDDCDDADSRAYPGNAEVCDAHDEDCNPDTFGFTDADGDGAASSACCNGTNCGSDCDDADNTVRPGVADGPMLGCDNVDNDCDGAADEGCPCVDGRTRECGSTAALMRIGECRPGSQFCVMGAWTETCTGEVRAAEELCDALDNDCDGTADEGVLRTYYRDGDADGFGLMTERAEACSAPAGYVPLPSDCNDANPAMNPAAPEVCDGLDNDCDSTPDDGLMRTWYGDADGDGFGTTTVTVMACEAPAGHVATGTDCDDADAAVNPSARDTCDGVDNDCNMTPDPGCSCTDGMTRMCGMTDTGECAFGMQRCVGGLWAECVGAIVPRTETCNTLDDDCDGMTDEMVRNTYYRDVDGDGFGVAGMTTMACSLPAGYSTLSTDCDDANPSRNPATFERCNGIDDDCNGTMDVGCACTDGMTQACGTTDVGECSRGVQTCVGGAWAGCTGNVEPGTETCNGLDDDCDGMTDEALTVSCYADTDSDGYGAGTASPQCRDASRMGFGFCPAGYTNVATDCNDSNAAIRPGATEICNGVDEDCDAMTDEMLTVGGCYVDADSDTYGTGAATTQCRDAARLAAGFCPAGYYNRAGDCNDASALVRPGATESCNGIDDDCDAMTDELVMITYYRDADSDGFGAAATTMTGCTAPPGYVANSTDCNDASATVYPGAPEICDGLIDHNCAMGTTDEPRRTFYRDADADLYGLATMTMSACTAPPGYVETPGDCNDADAGVRPGATELCNAADDDCDTMTDEGAAASCGGQYPGANHVSAWSCAAGGVCTITACSSSGGNWENCAGGVADGCETNADVSTTHCGACGNACGVSAECETGRCEGIRDIFAGADTTCLVRATSGRVVCWGEGSLGELDDYAFVDRPTPYPAADLVSIATGDIGPYFIAGSTVLVATTSRRVLGYAFNDYGQVGDGTTTSPRLPPSLSLPFANVVTAGYDFACRVDAPGTPRCSGLNTYLQLGRSGANSTTPVTVSGVSNATHLSAGFAHACARTTAGTVYCWGQDTFGQLGNGAGGDSLPAAVSLPSPATFVDAGYYHSCAIAAGNARCWGRGTNGQLGNGASVDSQTQVLVSGGMEWQQLALGEQHTCGFITGGTVYCWGDDSDFQLGNGPTIFDWSVPVTVSGVGAAATDIAAGRRHTCVLTSLGVYCWGGNNSGQIGDGSGVNQPRAVFVTR